MFQANGITFLDYNDFILTPIYLFLIIICMYMFRNVALLNTPTRKYFITGVMVKIVGGIAVGLIYGFYYKSGDTFYYFYDSQTFNNSLKDGFGLFFKLLALPAHTNTTATYDSTWWTTFFHDPSGWMVDKIYGVISIFTFHSYWVMAIVISVLSFSGVWALYMTFVDLYPQLYKQLAYCVLFVPSVFFWGSGVLKDSITFGCLGWITYCSYSIFFKRKKVVRNGLILLITSYIALQVKAYIIISFLPALLFWIFLTYRSRITNQFLRVISGPAVFSVSLVFGYLMVTRLGTEFSQFSLKNVMTTANTFQQWHTYLAENENASGYSLGYIDGTWQSIIKTFPKAINVTLFRPYLWEARSVIVLASAVESTLILGFTIYIFVKNGIRRPFAAMIKNPTIFFCILFSLIFGISVGFTAYNFGALVRYKIPCIPFYLVGLILLNHITTEERLRIKAEQLKRRPAFRLGGAPLPQPELTP
ncbi:MAG TPA: hypothetical protein VE978_10435 [Chitinophagales bacterium]|nr:hypothetical protein [Chitinophagales bacterium]